VFIAPILWLLAYYGGMLVSKVPAFGWYFMPPLPVYYTVVSLGIAQSLRWIGELTGQMVNVRSLFVPGTCLLAIALAWHLKAISHDISAAQRLEDTVRKPIGFWLRDHASRDERLALEPIGYIGYYSQLPVLDIIGLISPGVLPSYDPNVPNPLLDIVRRFKPDLLLLRPAEAAQLGGQGSQGALLVGGEYTLVKSFWNPQEQRNAFLLYRKARPIAPARTPAHKE
jgi:hypothetical protein